MQQGHNIEKTTMTCLRPYDNDDDEQQQWLDKDQNKQWQSWQPQQLVNYNKEGNNVDKDEKEPTLWVMNDDDKG